MKLAVVVAAILQIMASCVPQTSSAPPDTQMPQGYRGVSSAQSSIGDIPWRKLYDDPVLQARIDSLDDLTEALVQEVNLRAVKAFKKDA